MEGLSVGSRDGDGVEGLSVGFCVTLTVGGREGCNVVGALVGVVEVGCRVGDLSVGSRDGDEVEGLSVGSRDGD